MNAHPHTSGTTGIFEIYILKCHLYSFALKKRFERDCMPQGVNCYSDEFISHGIAEFAWVPTGKKEEEIMERRE